MNGTSLFTPEANRVFSSQLNENLHQLEVQQLKAQLDKTVNELAETRSELAKIKSDITVRGK